MDAVKMQHFKRVLEADKKHLLAAIARLEETGIGDTLADAVSELSRHDNHPADLGSETFERGKDIALRDNAHVMLEAVEHALAKIQKGTYGQCDECGRSIRLNRLEALPSAALCIECQREADRHEGSTGRPLEEDALAPPFHRTLLDTAEFNNVAYDGEDALQDALKYGSSDTPQDLPGSYDYKALFPNSNEHQGIVDRTDAIPVDYAAQPSRKRRRQTER
ncbi:MAG: TraR/DksA C4-type zinc finger protein [Negativicutes bacterium]|nr:TraR/DksA C4-type zinc finger protein [Negativicutes bacterium]